MLNTLTLHHVIYQLYLSKAEGAGKSPSTNLSVNCSHVFQTKTRSQSTISFFTLPCAKWALACLAVLTHAVPLCPSFPIIYALLICFSIPLAQGKLGNFFPAGLQLVT